MPAASASSGESDRPASLLRGVPGALPQDTFGRVLALARHLLELPRAAVHLAGTVYLAGTVHLAGRGQDQGGEETQEETETACPCAQPRAGAEGGSAVWLVPDARQDPHLRDHPAVRAGEALAYAAAPLLSPDGQCLGTLCVWGPQPRAFGPQEAETLRLLAALVADELELRRRAHELTQARDQARTLRDLAELTSEPLSAPEIAQRALRLLARTMRLDWAGLLHLAPHASGIVSDHPAEGGAGASAYAGMIRQRLAANRALEETLLGWERVFLDDPRAVAGRCPWLLTPQLLTPALGSAAWLHVPVEGGLPEGAHVLLLARLGEPAVWTPEERLLLEAAAQSVGVALERAGHVQALRRAALQDALTDLGNRRALDDALDAADRHLGQTGSGYVLGVVDLDGMKRVNDERGHASGDTLLREFARALPGPGLSAYRLGGDEYALLLALWPGADPQQEAQTLRRQVEAAARRVQALDYAADASLGVACVPQEAADATDALRTADARMYAEKRARRAAREAATGGAVAAEPGTGDGGPRGPLPWRA